MIVEVIFMIKNPYLKKLINKNLGKDNEIFSKEELDSIVSLTIEDKIDFYELRELVNLNELKIYNMELSTIELASIGKLNNLKELFIIRCSVDGIRQLDGMSLDTLYISDSFVDDFMFINNINVNNLYLENMGEIDLKDISIIRNVTSLSLDNTIVSNEDKMIFLDKIINLSIFNTGIKNIDTLVENDTLKMLVIDEEIYKNNILVVKKLKSRDVLVVNDMNQDVESCYD